MQYSFGKGLDNTPLLTQLVGGGRGDGPIEQHRSREGRPADMRHNFTGNVVYGFRTVGRNGAFGPLNGDGLGFAAVRDGLPINIPANLDSTPTA